MEEEVKEKAQVMVEELKAGFKSRWTERGDWSN